MLDFAYDPPERNPGKPWKWIVIDSLIIAGIAFIAALPADRLPTLFDAYVAVKAFMYSFLIQIATERGIKPWVYKKKNRNSSNGGK
ncbi:MAG: hypothetical protein LM558_00260 [Thermosphaera sp.]|nr:hypothetical protein [Thermosphaera sp.]